MPEQTFPILDELHQHTERLMRDQYGTYVIQHVLVHGHPDDKTKIISELRRKMLKYVKDQNAQLVVRKYIECVEPASLQFLVDAFKGQVSVIWGWNIVIQGGVVYSVWNSQNFSSLYRLYSPPLL